MSAPRGTAAEHFVAEAARVLSLSLDYEATIASLAQLAVPTFADWCFVDLVTEDGDALDRVAVGHHLPGSDETARWLKRRYPVKMDNPVGVARAILDGEPQLLTDLGDEFARAVARDGDHLRSLRALQIRSAVIAPLLVRGKSIGALSLMAKSRNFSDDDLWFVTQLGHSAAAAIDNARLFESERRARIRVTKLLESERRSNTRLRLLVQVGETLAQPLASDESLATIARLMVPVFADWCAVDLLEGRAIRRVATVHQDPAKVEHAERIAGRYRPELGDNSAIARVIAGGKAHFYPQLDAEVLEHAARDTDELALLRGEGLVSTIMVPLNTSGECIGALSLTTSDSGRVYDDADAEFAAELGRRVGIAIESSRMRRELEAAHDRMLRLFNQAPMSIAIYRGPNQVIEFANPMFLQVRGRGKDVLGKTFVEVFPESYPTTKLVLDRAFVSGKPQTFPEVRTMLDRGRGPEEAFFHLSFVALKDEQDQVDRMMSVSFEVTDRVLAQRALDAERGRLQTVFKQAPFPIGVFEGPEHHIVFANAKWEALVGRSLPAGQRLAAAVPELEAQGILAMHDRAFAGETVVGQEIPLELAVDGVTHLHHFHVVLHPLFDDTGKIEGHITMALDVSDQVRTRSEIDAARHDAEAANRAKDDFLAMLGHELRNPLAPIMTALNLMGLRGIVGAEREIRVITRQVQHLTRMVDDLLDVSRIIRGQIELNKETLELSELVARGLETASPLFEERNQYVEVKVPRHGLLLRADPARMAQALSNLFTNAAKYTNAGGHISVIAEQVDSEVVLRVSDDGVGIAEDMLERIFELFVQERQAIDRARGGLGLGLAIVKSVVTLHGGSVGAQSAGTGQGSVFSVRLPLLDPTRARRASSPPSAKPAAIAERIAQRILVVDDNEDAAEMLAMALRASGHVTRLAHDGPSALSALAEFSAQVALLDLGLPAMDGYELAAHIRAAYPGVRLVALTGYGQESDRERTRAAGFDEHLVKPAELEHVLRAVSPREPAS